MYQAIVINSFLLVRQTNDKNVPTQPDASFLNIVLVFFTYFRNYSELDCSCTLVFYQSKGNQQTWQTRTYEFRIKLQLNKNNGNVLFSSGYFLRFITKVLTLLKKQIEKRKHRDFL